MSELIQKYGKLLMENAQRVGIVLAAVLVAVIAFYFYTDRNAAAPPVPPPPPQRLETRLTDDNKDFQIVASTMLESNPAISDTANRKLVQLNMFDARSTAAQRERDRQFDAQYRRAEEAFLAERYDEALQIADGILEQNPLHHKATALKNQIARAQQPPPAEPVEDPTTPVDPMLGGTDAVEPGP
jgi:hypothetical protein